jgi:acyl transferase domain-containing protein
MFQAPCPKNWSICRIYADTQEALLHNVQHILQHREADLPTGIHRAPYRFIQAYQDKSTLFANLKTFVDQSGQANQALSPQPKICLLFTGQGAQWAGMGEALSQNFPAIAADIQDSITYLLDQHAIDLRTLVDPQSQACDLNQTLFTQPSMVLIELAITQALLKHHLHPDYLIGHSVGEIAASHFAGFYTKTEVLDLIAHRARLMQNMPPIGSMLACKADRPTIETLVLQTPEQRQKIQLAGINSPSQTILSGESEALLNAQKTLKEAKIRCIPLTVSHAFHSQLMAPMLPAFRKICANIQPHPPVSLPKLITNLEGRVATDHTFQGDYWSQHIIQPVHFLDSIRQAWAQGCRIFVEVGPQPVLTKLAEQSLPQDEPAWFIPCLSKKDPIETFLGALTQLETLL